MDEEELPWEILELMGLGRFELRGDVAHSSSRSSSTWSRLHASSRSSAATAPYVARAT